MNIEENNEGGEMAEESKDWIGKHWQILMTIAIVLIWGIRQESAISLNKDNNYKLYLQFDQYRKDEKIDNKDLLKSVDEMKLSLTMIITKFESLDMRYPLRRELDARYFKSVYNDND